VLFLEIKESPLNQQSRYNAVYCLFIVNIQVLHSKRIEESRTLKYQRCKNCRISYLWSLLLILIESNEFVDRLILLKTLLLNKAVSSKFETYGLSRERSLFIKISIIEAIRSYDLLISSCVHIHSP
jgi:hypothetical protein